MIVEHATHPQFLSNTYLVADGAGGPAFFIDAGGPVEGLIETADPMPMLWSEVDASTLFEESSMSSFAETLPAELEAAVTFTVHAPPRAYAVPEAQVPPVATAKSAAPPSSSMVKLFGVTLPLNT